MSEKKNKNRVLSSDKIDHCITIESDENFAFIVGYTSGGAPFGLTHEEFSKINNSHQQSIDNFKEINDAD
jgi:hypothetical protein